MRATTPTDAPGGPIGVDLGQSTGQTAVVVMSRVERPGRGDEAFEAAA